MMKKLLPTMIGIALAGGATVAAADVTVSGHLDESVLFWDAKVTGTGTLTTSGGTTTFSGSASADDANLVCTTCSIGFSGSEDLGNGLKAIFKLDFQFDINNRNSGGAITDRDQWVGLAGGFGKVRVGTISTVYKSHGAMIDPLYRTVFQARDIGLQSGLHSGAGEEGQGRATNTFRWDSADFNGIKLGAHYTLDSDETDGEDNNPYGIGASYSNGGILAFADYISNDGDGSPTQDELTAWKLGGKYSMGDMSVYGQYEDANEDFGTAGELDTETWHIGGSYAMGNNAIHVAYGQYEFDAGAGGTFDGDAFSIVGTHSLSKRTMIYGGYAQNEGDGSASGVSVPLGPFGGDSFSGTIDTEVDAFAVGLKHKF